MKKRKTGGLNRWLPYFALAVSAAILLSFAGVTAARYVLQQKKTGIAEGQEFYFSSDLLKAKSGAEAAPMYYVDPKEGSFTVSIYNWADTERVSTTDILYQVTAKQTPADGAAPAEINVTDLSPTPGILKAKTVQSAMLKITPVKDSGTVTVTVSTSAPFAETLTADFNMTLGNKYDFYMGSGAWVLNMTCADAARDNITIKLPAPLVPDYTDTRIKKAGSADTYIFSSPGQGVYTVTLLCATQEEFEERNNIPFADKIDLTQ